MAGSPCEEVIVFRSLSSANRLTVALVAGACMLGGALAPASADTVSLSLPAQVGQKLFFDTNLSASKKMACASCHDPNNAYAPSNTLAVQPGGPNLTAPGTRAVPSLRYKEYTPAYSDLLDNPDGVSPPGPGGGFMQDGRANTLADQVRLPLLAANEMANTSVADVVAKIQASAYAPLFQQAFGTSVFNDTQAAFAAAGTAGGVSAGGSHLPSVQQQV
jgi:cytochrome c peroxidase